MAYKLTIFSLINLQAKHTLTEINSDRYISF